MRRRRDRPPQPHRAPEPPPRHGPTPSVCDAVGWPTRSPLTPARADDDDALSQDEDSDDGESRWSEEEEEEDPLDDAGEEEGAPSDGVGDGVSEGTWACLLVEGGVGGWSLTRQPHTAAQPPLAPGQAEGDDLDGEEADDEGDEVPEHEQQAQP